MTDEDRERTGGRDRSVEEAFGLIGNEIRAGIVRALGDADDGESPWRALSFSELRSRVDADANSSKFNYHLQRLVGRFVAKSDGAGVDDPGERGVPEGEGYRLRPAGMKLYRAVRAGSFTREASVDPFGVGLDCYTCGSPVVAAYDDGVFEVRCSNPDCGRIYDHTLLPPSAVADADDEDLLARVDQFDRSTLLARSRGVCPTCGNALDARLVPADETPFESAGALDVQVNLPCDHCGADAYVSVGAALLYDPDLIAFCARHGLDVTDTPVWELEFAMTDRYVTVRDTDPWEVALELTAGDLAADGDTDASPGDARDAADRLELVVDGDLTVIERNGS